MCSFPTNRAGLLDQTISDRVSLSSLKMNLLVEDFLILLYLNVWQQNRQTDNIELYMIVSYQKKLCLMKAPLDSW
jgi:hypothetical protein